MTDPSPPVARVERDRFDLHLDAHERRILGSIVGELRTELDDPGATASDGSLARLFPPAYPDDAEADAAYADLVREDLAGGRRARLAVVEASLDAESLDEAQAAAWLAILNDARLVLGTGLGITDEASHELPGRDDPDALRKAVFAYLGWLVGSFTGALAEDLPAVPDDAA